MIAKQPCRLSGFSLTDKSPLGSFSEAAAAADGQRGTLPDALEKGIQFIHVKSAKSVKVRSLIGCLTREENNPLETFQRGGKLRHEHTAGGLFGSGCTIHHQTRGTKTSSSVKRITG